jgi:hypothetical protein
MLAAIGGLASGALGWQQATPIIIGGLVGMIWPENRDLTAAAQKTAGDVGAVVAAYQAGSQSAPAAK